MLYKYIISLFFLTNFIFNSSGQPSGECKILMKLHYGNEIIPSINQIFEKKGNHLKLIDTVSTDTFNIIVDGQIANANIRFDKEYLVITLWPDSKKINLLLDNSANRFKIEISISKNAPHKYASYFLEVPLISQNITIGRKKINTFFKREYNYKMNKDGAIILPYSSESN